MGNAIYQAGGISFFIRTEKHGDTDVLAEVVEGDCYRLRELQQSGFTPRVIFDVGAHIGSFSVLAHALWPEAAIFSFEPNKRSFELLCSNAPFSTCVNAAIRYDGADLLTDGAGATGGGFLTTKERFEDAAATKHAHDGFIYSLSDGAVALLTLEEALGKFQIDSIDLMKFDCEGSEIDCLMNMKEETACKVRRVVGEYHTEHGFEWFKQLAETTLPHLEIYGGNGHPIGPFWSRVRPQYSSRYQRQPPSHPKPAERKLSINFKHSGDIGDLLYSLPTVRALGGGNLHLASSDFTRLNMNQEILDTLRPLLQLQPYLGEIALYRGSPVDYDLDSFREYWRAHVTYGRSLAGYHLGVFGLDSSELDKPWLVVDNPQTLEDRPVLFHRSTRYNNPLFPWQRIADTYRERAAFVGLLEEHEVFCREFGPVPFHPTNDLLELARVIAGSQLFVGNQSAPYAIAEGLRVNTIQETYPPDPNCMFPRINALYVFTDTIVLPEIELPEIKQWFGHN